MSGATLININRYAPPIVVTVESGSVVEPIHWSTATVSPSSCRITSIAPITTQPQGRSRQSHHAATPMKGSQIARSSVAREMEAAIPGAALVLVSGAGHQCNIEAPEAFDDAVLRFLGELDTGQSSAT